MDKAVLKSILSCERRFLSWPKDEVPFLMRIMICKLHIFIIKWKIKYVIIIHNYILWWCFRRTDIKYQRNLNGGNDLSWKYLTLFWVSGVLIWKEVGDGYVCRILDHKLTSFSLNQAYLLSLFILLYLLVSILLELSYLLKFLYPSIKLAGTKTALWRQYCYIWA